MEFVKPGYEIMTRKQPRRMIFDLETYGRTCYKSEDKRTLDSDSKFVKMIVKRGHLSVIEHESITVKFVCDRGVSHELVRHRLCSFSQESTRYCNYKTKGLKFIVNNFLPKSKDNYDDKEYHLNDSYRTFLRHSELMYNEMIDFGISPQIARSILPNCLATEIVVTANLRQWRTIFLQRTAKAAHPQMRELMVPLCQEFKDNLPEIYGDIELCQ